MASMSSLELPDFLERIDGEIRITDHRVTLYHILKEYNAGESGEGIVLKLPTLKLATVYKCVAFYLEHQPEIDSYIHEYEKSLRLQESNAQPSVSRAELLRRLEDLRLKAHNAAEVSY